MSIEHELRAGTTPPGKVCERHLDDLIASLAVRDFRCVCVVWDENEEFTQRIETVEKANNTGSAVLALMKRHGDKLGMCSVKVEK